MHYIKVVVVNAETKNTRPMLGRNPHNKVVLAQNIELKICSA